MSTLSAALRPDTVPGNGGRSLGRLVVMATPAAAAHRAEGSAPVLDWTAG
jgi:hypothetical protein